MGNSKSTILVNETVGVGSLQHAKNTRQFFLELFSESPNESVVRLVNCTSTNVNSVLGPRLPQSFMPDIIELRRIYFASSQDSMDEDNATLSKAEYIKACVLNVSSPEKVFSALFKAALKSDGHVNILTSIKILRILACVLDAIIGASGGVPTCFPKCRQWSSRVHLALEALELLGRTKIELISKFSLLFSLAERNEPENLVFAALLGYSLSHLEKGDYSSAKTLCDAASHFLRHSVFTISSDLIGIQSLVLARCLVYSRDYIEAAGFISHFINTASVDVLGYFEIRSDAKECSYTAASLVLNHVEEFDDAFVDMVGQTISDQINSESVKDLILTRTMAARLAKGELVKAKSLLPMFKSSQTMNDCLDRLVDGFVSSGVDLCSVNWAPYDELVECRLKALLGDFEGYRRLSSWYYGHNLFRKAAQTLYTYSIKPFDGLVVESVDYRIFAIESARQILLDVPTDERFVTDIDGTIRHLCNLDAIHWRLSVKVKVPLFDDSCVHGHTFVELLKKDLVHLAVQGLKFYPEGIVPFCRFYFDTYHEVICGFPLPLWSSRFVWLFNEDSVDSESFLIRFWNHALQNLDVDSKVKMLSHLLCIFLEAKKRGQRIHIPNFLVDDFMKFDPNLLFRLLSNSDNHEMISVLLKKIDTSAAPMPAGALSSLDLVSESILT